MEIDMTDFAALADEYARLDTLIADLNSQRGEIKKQLIQKATFAPNKKDVLEATIVGNVADVIFTKTYPVTFSKDLAQTLLSAEDFERCHARAIDATIRPRVKIKVF
jgi:hypothetical protein